MADNNSKKLTTRKVIQVRGSLYVCIPKKYAASHGIERGDIMAIMMGESLRVTPMEKS
jgi:hypothetical protein